MRRFALPAACCAISSATLITPPLVAVVGAQAADTTATVAVSGNVASGGSASANNATPAPAKQETAAEQEERERAWELRAGSTYHGPVGGVYVVDAASGAPKSFRLAATADFFGKEDYLYDDDKTRFLGSSFALSVTPIKYLELSASVANRSSRNSRGVPEVLQSLGNVYFDVKAWGEPTKGLALGGDVLVNFKNGPSNMGVDASATSVGLRFNASLDLRKMTERHVPLQLRFNAGYLFDNSAKLIEGSESQRLSNLQGDGISNPDAEGDEYRHLVRRDERLAFGINRVDQFQLALGLEVPIDAHEKFQIHPLAEWQLGIPVNRQDFDCPYVRRPGGGKLPGTDSCLANEGVDVFPQRIFLGARMYPGGIGLNVLAGVEVGVGGATNFVQELAPNTPYKVLLGLGYTADLKKKPPQVVVEKVETRVEVASTLGRVHGNVVESGEDVVVANARVSFPGRDVSRILTGADGTFTSYAFAPGAVQIDVEADGYEPGQCSTAIPATGGDVSLACMLVALPRVGNVLVHVIDDKGTPLPGVTLNLVGGGEAKSSTSDADGRARVSELKPGEYTVRIEQAGYLVSVSRATVKVREESSVTVQLVPVPKSSSVSVKGDKIQVKGTIYFAPNTATIEARSHALLVEIANVLMQHSELQQIEVQGHTDDTGSAARNTQLSEQRAQAVKDWLATAGVERDRLIAKGYGADKPLLPNVTEQNRARNRRVEFVIQRRAGE